MGFWQAFIMVAVLAVLMALMRRTAAQPPAIDLNTGGYVLRHGAVMWVCSIGGFLLPVVGVGSLMLFVIPRKSEHDWLYGVAFIALFSAITLPLIWESVWVKLLVTPDGLDCTSPWQAHQFIRWEDIESIQFSASSQWFLVRARGGRTFRVSAYLVGVQRFTETCIQLLPPEKFNATGFQGSHSFGKPQGWANDSLR